MEDHASTCHLDVAKVLLDGRAASSQPASFLFGFWAVVKAFACYSSPCLGLNGVQAYVFFVYNARVSVLLLGKRNCQYLMIYNNVSGAEEMTQLVRACHASKRPEFGFPVYT